ncbi:Non-specific lipid-transfer protein-like protein [Camellia lanceoleosa]|uniref:Non-specific lipid-transfer protein-like protein n=1 Tax=Camellia lanceoleosa TaxID=1840588 RepID=A0ACC0H910_9ERIC|nr:Non-specific lipid-transfer protein-like protein [Camellia lanceoleosa]
MARQRIGMGLVVLMMVTMLWEGAAAQSSWSCTNAIISMSPCLNYITGNSLTPYSGCCTQLANVVRSQPQCLCQLLNGAASTAESPAGTPESPNTVPSGTGSKTVPSMQSSSSDAGSTTISLLFFLLFSASYGSTSSICSVHQSHCSMSLA